MLPQRSPPIATLLSQVDLPAKKTRWIATVVEVELCIGLLDWTVVWRVRWKEHQTDTKLITDCLDFSTPVSRSIVPDSDSIYFATNNLSGHTIARRCVVSVVLGFW